MFHLERQELILIKFYVSYTAFWKDRNTICKRILNQTLKKVIHDLITSRCEKFSAQKKQQYARAMK